MKANKKRLLEHIVNQRAKLIEGYAWERKPGGPLPTLEDTTARHQKSSINEGNSYYDLKQQYYEISDNIIRGGIVDTLKDIKRKNDTDAFDKIPGGFNAELKIWTAIQKLYHSSNLGRIL
jgi:hypothetical protein